jgi:hypothetical protein
MRENEAFIGEFKMRKLLGYSIVLPVIFFCADVFAKDICVEVDTSVNNYIGKFMFKDAKPLTKLGQVSPIVGINKFDYRAGEQYIYHYPISGTATVVAVNPVTKKPTISVGFTVFRDIIEEPYHVQGTGESLGKISAGKWYNANNLNNGNIAWNTTDCKTF